MNWYYYQNESVIGPISMTAILELQRAGVITGNTLIRSEESEDWIPLDSSAPAAPKQRAPLAQMPAREKVQPRKTKALGLVGGGVLAVVVVVIVVLFLSKKFGIQEAPSKQAVESAGSEKLSEAKEQFLQGQKYYKGEGVAQDFEEALKWFQKAAEHGDSGAQDALGTMYLNGEGVKEDLEEALIWWSKAAEQGFFESQFKIGSMHKTRGDKVLAYMWLNLSASSDDSRVANVSRKERDALARDMSTEEISKAQQLCREWKPGQANQPGSFRPSNVKTSDDTLASKKPTEAEDYFLRGQNYHQGTGVDKDYDAALKCYEQAAELGEPRAQAAIGKMYITGEGVEKDPKEALIWFSMAAEQGEHEAQGMLGSAHKNLGNKVLSYMWLSLAATSDNRGLSELLQRQCDALASEMSQKEIREAQRLCREWKPDQSNQPGTFKRPTTLANETAADENTDSNSPISSPRVSADQQSRIPSAHQNIPEKVAASETKSPLVALEVFKAATLGEAKECIRLLDEVLKKDASNKRVALVRSAIMEVFRAEASLSASLDGQAEANKQYQIKMQNLEIASRPSPLTGKVNTAEVERISRETAEVKSASGSRIDAAKADLRKSLDSAKTTIPAPDNEPLSRVWSQIENRNDL